MNQSTENFLVSENWLVNHLNDENLVVVDCQWDENAYLRAHIPGALMRPGHPYVKAMTSDSPDLFLPSEMDFLKMMKDLGINNDTQVICYDEWDNHFATRLWWVMDFYGHKNTRLLNGGWQAWINAGHKVSVQPHKSCIQSAPFTIEVNESKMATMTEVIAAVSDDQMQIIDVRSDDEFNGANQVINKRSRHIPNALQLEWHKLLAKEGSDDGVNYFHSLNKMESLIQESGIDQNKPLIIHCQSGVRASFTVFCMAMLGYPNVKLYDGSMFEWANRDDTPLV